MEATQLEKLENLLGEGQTAIARDLNLNLKRVLTEGSLSGEEGLLTLLATATSVEHRTLAEFAQEALAASGMDPALIQEARESAAMMGMLNMYYRFRHMIGAENGKADDYRTAGLRMTALAKPVLGKERFEMLAFAVSVLNGCESCIRSHEKVLRDHGLSADKVHDLVRIAAVVKAQKALKF
ncbi:MAG: carboxymuconolactone decarboxylase family protein [Bacteriovoracia bacterium]